MSVDIAYRVASSIEEATGEDYAKYLNKVVLLHSKFYALSLRQSPSVWIITIFPSGPQYSRHLTSSRMYLRYALTVVITVFASFVNAYEPTDCWYEDGELTCVYTPPPESG